MLSGRSPFLSATKSVNGREDSASSIMRRIKAGDCKIDKEAGFSPAAKALTKGLLTVDPKKRLTLDDLFKNGWINNHSAMGGGVAANLRRNSQTHNNNNNVVNAAANVSASIER